MSSRMTLTDKEYLQLTISIAKALNSFEMPTKSKHARAAIIGSYHSNGGHAFWAIAIRQPLQENRIVAWKFCTVLHKLLREGHSHVPQHSMRHRQMIMELGKLWGHLNDGYGQCIKQYSKLLVTKLEFHDRNPRIPGNLILKRGELERIAGNDINNYFQLAVEMFDYLDELVALQATIFNSMSTFHVSSMTSAGQCRLAPLITCIQDSNQLYDFVVRLMFRLHANLPEDLLSGHRDRFRALFAQLKSFYRQSRDLQYFVNLITVPQLPHGPPNFLEQSELGNYTAPIVVVPQEREQDSDSISEVSSVVDNLVELQSAPPTPPRAHQPPPTPQPPPIDFERLIVDRDDLIKHLQSEIDRYSQILKETNSEQSRYQEHMARLHSELTNVQNDLSSLRIEKQELEMKLEAAPIVEAKSQADDEKAKAAEKNFQQLKVVYQQIRDEHVKLLRQHGEISKKLATSTKEVGEISNEREELKCKLQELEAEQAKVSENLQQSSNDKERETEEFNQRIRALETEKLELLDQFQEVESNKSAEIAELKMNQITLKESLKNMNESLELTSSDKDKEIANFNEKIKELEKEKLVLLEKFQETESMLSSEITGLKSTLENVEQSLKESHDKSAILEDEKLKLEAEHQETMCKKSEVEGTYQESLVKVQLLQSASDKCVELEDEMKEKEEVFKSKLDEMESQKNEVAELLNSNILNLTLEKDQLENEKKIQEEEKEELEKQLTAKSEECDAIAIKLQDTETEMSNEIAQLRQQIQDNEEKYQQLNANYDRVLIEKETSEIDCQDLLHQQEQLTEKLAEANLKYQALELDLTNSRIHGETGLRTLLEACVKTSEKLTLRAITESEMPGASGTATYFIMMAEELQDVLTKLKMVHESYLKDNTNNVEALARKVIVGGHLLASVHEQGMAICNKSTNIDSGEKIANEIKELGQNTSQLFQSLHTASKSNEVHTQIDGLKEKLYKLTSMIGDMTNNNDQIEQIGDMMEKELSSMDKAIAEAAQKIVDMLLQSRASDSGIKLEVNGKILDACTTLMKAIQILVQKSRKVQAEIISLGKGTASAKEFYKRNHQWTEGMISAAKSVAQGANFLVDAANKAVSGEVNHQLDIVVAAQEIAACTAQLVVASRVKAPRNSSNLQELSVASKGVTQATGTVVATAKDCSQRLEDTQDLDLTKLTIHQAKTKEMEVQVKVLELEQALQVERMRLAALRRKNYQAAAE